MPLWAYSIIDYSMWRTFAGVGIIGACFALYFPAVLLESCMHGKFFC